MRPRRRISSGRPLPRASLPPPPVSPISPVSPAVNTKAKATTDENEEPCAQEPQKLTIEQLESSQTRGLHDAWARGSGGSVGPQGSIGKRGPQGLKGPSGPRTYRTQGTFRTSGPVRTRRTTGPADPPDPPDPKDPQDLPEVLLRLLHRLHFGYKSIVYAGTGKWTIETDDGFVYTLSGRKVTTKAT